MSRNWEVNREICLFFHRENSNFFEFVQKIEAKLHQRTRNRRFVFRRYQRFQTTWFLGETYNFIPIFSTKMMKNGIFLSKMIKYCILDYSVFRKSPFLLFRTINQIIFRDLRRNCQKWLNSILIKKLKLYRKLFKLVKPLYIPIGYDIRLKWSPKIICEGYSILLC